MSIWTYSGSATAFGTNGGIKNSIAAKAGVFVAPVSGGSAIYSLDGGVTWANSASYPGGDQVSYGNGIFVCATSSITLGPPLLINYGTSTDGINWTNRAIDVNAVLGTVVNTFHGVLSTRFVNGAFYLLISTDIFGASVEVLTSVDGINWTDALAGGNLPGLANDADIAFGGGVWAIQINDAVWSGASLAALTQHIIFGSSANSSVVCYGASKFIAISGSERLLYSSPDGVAWTSFFVPPDTVTNDTIPISVQFIDSKFYCCVNDSLGNDRFFSSPDGVAWTEENAPNPPAPGFSATWIVSDGTNLVAQDGNRFPDVSIIYAAGSGTAVPNVVGDSLPTAVNVLTTAGFTIGTVTIQAGGTVDVIASQTPVGGTIEPAGFPIDLVVSTGPARIISKLTQKLMLYLHRIFDKNPYPQLAFRVRSDGTGLTWSIANGVLTLTPTGGTATARTFSIANFSIGQLAQFIAALPGYSVPYQDTSAYALLSALALLDSSGDMNVSNGDHVYGYTTLLWAYIETNGSELAAARDQIPNALRQMNTIDAEDEWLDYHGSFYNVPRNQSELDPDYSPRMIANVLTPRGNNVAIAIAIEKVALNVPTVRVIDSIDNTSIAITYNGLIHFDGSEFYDAGLGPSGAEGFFDVDFSYDFTASVTQDTYFAQILQTVEAFRDAGTQLRAVIFRNQGSTMTLVSDSFVGRVRVIVYDDLSGNSYRLLESGVVRLLEDGTARILES